MKKRAAFCSGLVVVTLRVSGCANLPGKVNLTKVAADAQVANVTTGDGIISALHVLALMKRNNTPLSELARFMDEYPQKLVSLPVRERIPIEELPLLSSVISDADKALQVTGRVVVRYSGTENKIRLLVEAKEASDVELWLSRLTEAVKKELGS